MMNYFCLIVCSDNKQKPKRERRLQTDDGRFLNVNEPKYTILLFCLKQKRYCDLKWSFPDYVRVDFTILESEDRQSITVDVAVWK